MMTRAVLTVMVMTFLPGIVGDPSAAWAHSFTADPQEARFLLIAIALFIAFVALIWGLASLAEKHLGRRRPRGPRKRRRGRALGA